MIRDIAAQLDNLGWTPVENSTTSVSYAIQYAGMEPDESWRPEVRELYEISLWIDEAETNTETQANIQDACRRAYGRLTRLFDTNLQTAFSFGEVDASEADTAPTVTMMFRTVEARGRGDWQ